MLWLVSFTFSKEEEDEEQQHGQICENYAYPYFTPSGIFSPNFLLVVTFSHVLHVDVLRRQIELKLKVKTEISLCMAIMQNHPLPSPYTQYYCTHYCVIDTLIILLDIPVHPFVFHNDRLIQSIL